jgi:copper homeostasis protein
MLLEVCVATVDDAVVAANGGADRLEVNAALELGGLTPSLGLFAEIRRCVSLPLIAMVRPRPGGFRYSASDFDVMQRDAATLLNAGADGLAFGILTASGEVDVERNAKLRELCGDRQAVFHRAFDEIPEPFAALEALIAIGFNRVMTSGQLASAHSGISMIRALIQRTAGRIEVLPAAGINQENVAEVIARTGCTQIHGSMRGKLREARTNPEEVAAIRARLDACQNQLG